MAIEITKTFVVKTPVALAWNFLTDPRRVASCLPGAAITDYLDNNTHAGTITVKVGPITATYKGALRFERLDPVARTAEVRASGQDVRGKGGAEMRMTSRLVEIDSGETQVIVASDITVMGMLAQFGRGMIQDVSDQMFQRFVEAMRAQLEVPSGALANASSSAVPGVPSVAAPALDLVSVGSQAAARAVGRAFRRPAVWAGALALLAFAIGYRTVRRRREALASAA